MTKSDDGASLLAATWSVTKLAEIRPAAGEPSVPPRSVRECGPETIHLVEATAEAVRRIGPEITHTEVTELAAVILANAGRNTPDVLFKLALGYVAATANAAGVGQRPAVRLGPLIEVPA